MPKAFVVGNASLDQTLSVAALPKPGASIHGRPVWDDAGGKGLNQAVCLARAGVETTLTAAVGQDSRADDLRRHLSTEPVSTRLLTRTDVPTDLSLILLSDAEDNVIVTTDTAAGTLTPSDAEEALAGTVAGDLLLMQGNLSAETTGAALMDARARGLVSCVNPSPMRAYFVDLLSLIDIAFVNEDEAQALGGVDALRQAGIGTVVRTLGRRGAELYAGDRVQSVPAERADAVDPTGAGDSFMAASLASAALRCTRLDLLALRHGVRAATLTVSRPGTVAAFPNAAEFAAILAER